MRVCVCVMDSLSLPISHGVCRPEILTTLCLFELIKAVRKSCVMESEFFKSIYKVQTVSVCTKQIFLSINVFMLSLDVCFYVLLSSSPSVQLHVSIDVCVCADVHV